MEVEERISLILEDGIAALRRTFATAMTLADELSPIEQVLAAAFLMRGLQCGFPPTIIEFGGCQSLDQALADVRRYPCKVIITPQVKIDQYRADFLVAGAGGGKTFAAVVECDGHDFHEKTKAQAAHDKKRDRFFAGEGLHVLRYTGSEIWRDPERCADEAISFVAAKVREWEFTRVSQNALRREQAKRAGRPAGKKPE